MADIENFDMSALCAFGVIAIAAGTYGVLSYFGITVPSGLATLFTAGLTTFAGLAGRYAPGN